MLPPVATNTPSTNGSIMTNGSVLATTAAAASTAAPPLPFIVPDQEDVTALDLECLVDLPPVSLNCVRLYLCRHGETNYNLQRKIQGSRIDASLNAAGQRMAQRIGMSLAMLKEEAMPSVAVHSALKRSRETSELACRTLAQIVADGMDPQLFLRSDEQVYTSLPSTLLQRFEELPEIGEVDFGVIEEDPNDDDDEEENDDKEEEEEAAAAPRRTFRTARADIAQTASAWASGNIQVRHQGGGETGQEVLERVASGLWKLATLAAENGGSVMAVSHGAFLRHLLATVLDVPLSESGMFIQKNGCINVLDVEMTTSRGEEWRTLQSKLFAGGAGGKSSRFNDWKLLLPSTKVIRINERRHLVGL